MTHFGLMTHAYRYQTLAKTFQRMGDYTTALWYAREALIWHRRAKVVTTAIRWTG